MSRLANLIHPDWQDDLFRYIAGIIKNKGKKPIITGGHLDHIHLLFSLRPSKIVSDLIRDIKNNSTRFINEPCLTAVNFQWQEGFGAFSYSRSQLDRAYNYILKQEKYNVTPSGRGSGETYSLFVTKISPRQAGVPVKRTSFSLQRCHPVWPGFR